jgi:hypothetical protein
MQVDHNMLKGQLDRIEDTVQKLWERVNRLEHRASFWGAVGGAIAMLSTRLMGCM